MKPTEDDAMAKRRKNDDYMLVVEPSDKRCMGCGWGSSMSVTAGNDEEPSVSVYLCPECIKYVKTVATKTQKGKN